MSIAKREFVAACTALAVMMGGCGEAAAPVVEPPPPPVAEVPPPPPAEIFGDFASIDAWQQLGGGPSPEGLADGSYTFAPLVGALSRKSLPAKEGDKFAVDYTVNLVAAPKNGKAPAYVAGPMFLDASGAVISWGSVEQPLTEETRTTRVEAAAPAGTTVVHLYISGMWSPELPSPDGKVAYTAAKLESVK